MDILGLYYSFFFAKRTKEKIALSLFIILIFVIKIEIFRIASRKIFLNFKMILVYIDDQECEDIFSVMSIQLNQWCQASSQLANRTAE